jgi:hypothetical protein
MSHVDTLTRLTGFIVNFFAFAIPIDYRSLWIFAVIAFIGRRTAKASIPAWFTSSVFLVFKVSFLALTRVIYEDTL